MNALEAKDAILGVFKSVWDTFPGAVAVYPDIPGATPASDVLWARATVQHNPVSRQTLAGATGTRRFTATGFVWVQVFAPAGDGSTGATTAAQALVNAYRNARLDVWFRNVVMVEAGSGDGAFTRIDVKANFEYDDIM